MANVKIVDQNNVEVGSLELASDVFGVDVRPEILNLVVRAHRASLRAGTHATKARGEVSGGGKKPWKQKGTGRARVGSTRNPVWRGGGVAFGPKPRSYDFKVNKKVRSLALKMALTSKAIGEKLTVVDKLELPEVKTKLFADVVGKLGLKKALIVVGGLDKNLALSARNLPHIKVLEADKLSVLDVLTYPELVMLTDAVKSVEERLK
ncbi:ribosomal protein L4/L1e [Desulfovibrio sp. X2]|uniref:50S ribosomal protein L4 n=1 Tax=Desulfovibrio sp. X2 TaxID=941449 RepID=UPI0003587132|nr:50S ribosomal protein L4 [Desulfovibrio sp. X2]EPR42621.1 ribosomal protein L4/L1e [Desulfovibrio sp. X2]